MNARRAPCQADDFFSGEAAYNGNAGGYIQTLAVEEEARRPERPVSSYSCRRV
ncbi:MAG TPA: hypothetical protein VEX60_09875 [Pyrinomonadaceae bacterium]|nr:hypothetical protein [Pyrinomonadaceae bacterium]